MSVLKSSQLYWNALEAYNFRKLPFTRNKTLTKIKIQSILVQIARQSNKIEKLKFKNCQAFIIEMSRNANPTLAPPWEAARGLLFFIVNRTQNSFNRRWNLTRAFNSSHYRYSYTMKANISLHLFNFTMSSKYCN